MEHAAVPPLNPVCKKSSFKGFGPCGIVLEFFSPAKASKCGLLNLKFPYGACGTVCNSSIFLCRMAF